MITDIGVLRSVLFRCTTLPRRLSRIREERYTFDLGVIEFPTVALIRVIEVLVVRNAGGRAEPAIRDLTILDSLVGVNDIMIVHHTGQSSSAASAPSGFWSHFGKCP